MSLRKTKKPLSTTDQNLYQNFQTLNSLPDYDLQNPHKTNFTQIIQLVNKIVIPQNFNSSKFQPIFKICIHRILNITTHEKCMNITRLEIARLISQIFTRCLGSNNFHVLMFELYKILKDFTDKILKIKDLHGKYLKEQEKILLLANRPIEETASQVTSEQTSSESVEKSSVLGRKNSEISNQFEVELDKISVASESVSDTSDFSVSERSDASDNRILQKAVLKATLEQNSLSPRSSQLGAQKPTYPQQKVPTMSPTKNLSILETLVNLINSINYNLIKTVIEAISENIKLIHNKRLLAYSQNILPCICKILENDQEFYTILKAIKQKIDSQEKESKATSEASVSEQESPEKPKLKLNLAPVKLSSQLYVINFISAAEKLTKIILFEEPNFKKIIKILFSKLNNLENSYSDNRNFSNCLVKQVSSRKNTNQIISEFIQNSFSTCNSESSSSMEVSSNSNLNLENFSYFFTQISDSLSENLKNLLAEKYSKILNRSNKSYATGAKNHSNLGTAASQNLPDPVAQSAETNTASEEDLTFKLDNISETNILIFFKSINICPENYDFEGSLLDETRATQLKTSTKLILLELLMQDSYKLKYKISFEIKEKIFKKIYKFFINKNIKKCRKLNLDDPNIYGLAVSFVNQIISEIEGYNSNATIIKLSLDHFYDFNLVKKSANQLSDFETIRLENLKKFWTQKFQTSWFHQLKILMSHKSFKIRVKVGEILSQFLKMDVDALFEEPVHFGEEEIDGSETNLIAKSTQAEIAEIKAKIETFLYSNILFDEVDQVADSVELISKKYLNQLMINILYGNETRKIVNSAKCYEKLFTRIFIINQSQHQVRPKEFNTFIGSLIKFLLAHPNLDIYKAVIPVLNLQFYNLNEKDPVYKNKKILFTCFRFSVRSGFYEKIFLLFVVHLVYEPYGGSPITGTL